MMLGLQVRAARLAGRLAPQVAPRARRPAFILGCGRSGTTVLLNALAGHREVAAWPGEANDLWHPTLYPWHRTDGTIPPMWADPEAFTRASIASWPERHGEKVLATFGAFQALRRRPVFVNKSPMLSLMVPTLRELVPEAKFVHLVRDGRAVTASLVKKELPKLRRHELYATSGHLPNADDAVGYFARSWSTQVEAIDSALVGADALTIRYEDLAARPAEVMASITSHLGISVEQVPNVDNRNHPDPAVDTVVEGQAGGTLSRFGYIARMS
jgi:protein-tyrosine sulfotransferase